MRLTSKDIAKMIDHSLLSPGLTDDQLKEGCEIAKQYDAASCCVKPYHVAMTRDLLEGSDVLVCAVIAFPHGNSATEIKVAETEQVIRDGAVEVDMVVNLGKVLQGDWNYVEQDIRAVNDACTAHDAKLKVIFATDFLSDEQIIKLCEIGGALTVGWVKTCTGYNYVKDENGKPVQYGATDRVLKLMADHTPPEVEVKAAVACRTLERFLEVREKFGVTRVGTGQTATIVTAAREMLDS